MRPIGSIVTPYSEKFGIPRQPGLAEAARGRIVLHPEFDQPGVYDGLETCSHLWLTFWFHHHDQSWSPKVRPPRLGGNRKLGVFATRSPRRPNPIGLSVVRVLSLESQRNHLEVAGVDLLNGTPILDIKPYLPYSDAPPQAHSDFAPSAPVPLRVEFSAKASEDLACDENLRVLIEQVLSQDPRPAYHRSSRVYGTTLAKRNIKWTVDPEQVVQVLSVEPATSCNPGATP